MAVLATHPSLPVCDCRRHRTIAEYQHVTHVYWDDDADTLLAALQDAIEGECDLEWDRSELEDGRCLLAIADMPAGASLMTVVVDHEVPQRDEWARAIYLDIAWRPRALCSVGGVTYVSFDAAVATAADYEY